MRSGSRTSRCFAERGWPAGSAFWSWCRTCCPRCSTRICSISPRAGSTCLESALPAAWRSPRRHTELVRAQTVPDQAEARQEQETEHDIAKMLVAQRVVDARAGPCADQRARKCDHREPDHLERDEARGGLQHQSGGEHGEIEELEDAAPLVLIPAADVGPQDRKRPRQSGKAT